MHRPNTDRLRSRRLRPASRSDRWVASPARDSASGWDPVAIQPGATPFTVIPWRATSKHRDRVSPNIPAFAAAYPASNAMPVTGPVVEATLTMRPERRAFIPRKQARVT